MDEHLGSLAEMRSLNRLDMSYNPLLNGKVLQGLAGNTSLVELHLQGTNCDDDSLVPLATLTNLTDLSLGSTRITNAGLAVLDKITSLEALDISLTGVTDEGLAQLKNLHR